MAALGALSALPGCADLRWADQLAATNRDAAAFTSGALALPQDDAARAAAAQRAETLLAQPLGQPQAVQLALTQSPALQALLAQAWADGSAAAQGGRIANPLLSWERSRLGDELEIARLLSFGLFDLISLPWRAALAQQRVAQLQLQLSAAVVDQVTQVRQAWVRAVAAAQRQVYAQQVLESAEAGAELARRMAAAGNFNKLAQARQQVFHADALAQHAAAAHQATQTREALVRLLGLNDTQAQRLALPERLPELPAAPLAADAVAQAALDARLDVRLARAGFESAARAQGLAPLTTWTDVELGLRHDSAWPAAGGAGHDTRRGIEIGVRLPLFDFGGLRRDALNAQTLAAGQRLEATQRAAGSHLREGYSAYRAAYDIARHQRDALLPLRRLIAEENLLRYNAMLIGVFDLLADAREQVAGVVAALAADEQFWLADAALQAALVGRPSAYSVAAPAGGADAAASPAAH